MGDLVQLVDDVSVALNPILTNLQLAPLVQGGILFGARHVDEMSAPPRIVMVPIGGEFGGPVATTSPSGKVEQFRQRARPLWSENTEIHVHVWGAASPTQDPKENFRITQTYAYAFLIACHRLATTQIKPGRFEWVSQGSAAEQREGLGDYVILTVTVMGSAADLPVNIAPPGVKLVPQGFPGYSGKPPNQ